MTKSNNLLADYAAKKQDICIKNDTISDSLFREYGVNRGLRDVNGKGVLTGLTNISEIVSFKTGEDGSSVPCDGQLWYRGYNVKTLTNNLRPGEFGFEKIAYLLLFGQLPSESELAEFTEVLGRSRTLPWQTLFSVRSCSAWQRAWQDDPGSDGKSASKAWENLSGDGCLCIKDTSGGRQGLLWDYEYRRQSDGEYRSQGNDRDAYL